MNGKSNLNFTNLKERSRLKSGKLSKKQLEPNSNREWKWKKLSEKRELSKLDLSRRLLELSTRKSLN